MKVTVGPVGASKWSVRTTPQSVEDFVAAFDSHGEVYPFTFNVDFS